MRVYLKGKKRIDLNYGRIYPFYDVASLTKIAFTLEAFIQSWLRKKWSFSSRVEEFLPWVEALPTSATKNLRVEQLLCHSSGLPAWKPFYSSLLNLNCSKDSFACSWSFLSTLLRKELLQIKSKKNHQNVYSDIGFLLLGCVLESIYDRPLLGVWNHDSMKDVRKGSTWHFCLRENATNHFKKSSYAPTSHCPWQKKILQGEADDKNTRALGGLAPHAGLFASMEDLSRFGLLWRRRFHNYFSDFKPFFHPRNSSLPFGLGWMFPSAHGGSSCGTLFAPNSFGHTAFTGPSLWYDTQKDLLVLILSHRIHLSKEGQGKKNNRKAYFRFRASLHDEIVKLLLC